MIAGPRRVLFVLANGGRGGMQAQVRLIAGAMALRGVEVTIAVGGGDLEPVEGVNVVPLAPFTARSPWLFIRSLRRLVASLRADIVHGHGLRLAWPLALCGAKRCFVTCHGLDPRRARPTVILTRLARIPVMSCGEGPHSLLARHGLASTVINNALGPRAAPRTSIELRQRFALADEVAVAVLPARFSEQKNHLLLLEAMALVRSEIGDRAPEIVCMGEGPLLEATRAAAHIVGGRPLLRCPGYVSDGAGWIGAGDFFVLPSRWEGQPQVVLEALANQLSVVTSTQVGVEDLIFPGVNGSQVGNAAEFAKVISKWSIDSSSRPTDPEFSASILANHEINVVLDSLFEVYRTS